MKAFNHWKLQKLQKSTNKAVLWGFGLVLLLLGTVFKETINLDLVSKIIGITSIIVGICLFVIEKNLWKTEIMNFPLFENYWTPVLEGRWEGKFTRDKIDHPFVIEIKQSFNSISCITYSKNSSSTAYAAELLFNEQANTYQLIYYWQAKTKNSQQGTGDTNIFNGFTVLDVIIESKTVTRLEGLYFTDRQPNQTRGTLCFSKRQKVLKNSFD